MISPYDASFQLSYLYQSGIIDIVYGSTDLLLTKIDKFIWEWNSNRKILDLSIKIKY